MENMLQIQTNVRQKQLDPYTPYMYIVAPRAITSYEFQRMCEFYFC